MTEIINDTAKKEKKGFFKNNAKFLIICGIILVALIAVDQITKTAFQRALWPSKTEGDASKVIRFIGDFIMFEFTLNRGASLGMMQGKSWLFFVLTVIGIPLFAVIAFVFKKDSKLAAYGIAVVMAGIIGNAIDRAFFMTRGFFAGGVRDFIGVGNWFICNVADICISVGMALFVIGILFVGENPIFNVGKKKEENGASPKETDFDGE